MYLRKSLNTPHQLILCVNNCKNLGKSQNPTSVTKRKRTANFTPEEKLKFVRLLREEGQCIISKVTAHDAQTNKEKELAWAKIAKIHSSSGNMIRTSDTLKKLWGKLKGEAKIYKATSRHSESGTVGDPPKKIDDPVLELVADIIGGGSTGMLNINDSDTVAVEVIMENDCFVSASPPAEYLDDSILNESIPEDKMIDIEPNQAEDENILSPSPEKDKKEKQRVYRRRPNKNTANERTIKINQKKQASHRFAAERLRAEREKINLIIMKQKHVTELHSIKMENESLKNKLLQTLLKKVSDADTNDATKLAQFLLKQDNEKFENSVNNV